MPDRTEKKDTDRSSRPGGGGMQGIDKAPGEEPAGNTSNPVWESQKGKNKVDGDPSLDSDKPIEEDYQNDRS